ncbi:ABC transporter permease [Desulfovibrio aminophilus]|nr:ABC transporter permease [Desulfovibrio aminophilus]MCM0753690.1 ABC transporter permease [Desulfovibrio aminophilus]
MNESAALRIDYAPLAPDGLALSFAGRLDSQALGRVWDEILARAGQAGVRRVLADLSGVEALDGAGIALLLRLRLDKEAQGGGLELRGLPERYERLLGLFDASRLRQGEGQAKSQPGLVERAGLAGMRFLDDLRQMVAFVGECTLALGYALRHPRRVRWQDMLLTCERAGAESLPIILLIGFLMGLIMAFQSAMSLERFGAQIFVPNMLGLVMFRELGGLVTAILLAGRSGSSFAAEIGTMKVNEEVNALVTMGLDPVRFLVAPKVLAAVAMMPLMILFFNFASLVGGAVVMLSLEFPLATYTSRVFANLGMVDFLGGLFKGLIFSLLVAGVGCLRGLNTGAGAGAVGQSTTSAVVSGIILIAVADGIFAVSFYYLGI